MGLPFNMHPTKKIKAKQTIHHHRSYLTRCHGNSCNEFLTILPEVFRLNTSPTY